MDHLAFNREAWDKKAARGSRWTVPVDSEVVAAARLGDWSVILTPTRPVPRDWFPTRMDCDLLALASGGGQQGPVLAAAGARVTVYDLSPAQLARDEEVAAREGLDLVTVPGDMADLSCFDDASFDLIFHPVANCFVPDLAPVWRECFRVLRPGGALLSGFMNPVHYVFDFEKAEKERVLDAVHPLPFADAVDLDQDALDRQRAEGWPLEWSHTLETQIGGQCVAGFHVTGFYEDVFGPEEDDLASRYTATMLATRAVKPGTP
ncbi:MAG: class I SAM-dependent methyltransferase [bacterium]|nr:class I SAM-dependent methyltransferase [bacterium]